MSKVKEEGGATRRTVERRKTGPGGEAPGTVAKGRLNAEHGGTIVAKGRKPKPDGNEAEGRKPKNHRKEWTEAESAKVWELYQLRWTMKGIATILGRTREAVAKQIVFIKEDKRKRYEQEKRNRKVAD